MQKIIIPGAEPFFLPAGKTGCLFVHGFTGTPKEMRLMGNYLQNEGITALGIRLAGHGTDIKHMVRMRWQDWFASVEDGFHVLQGICDRVFIAGLSMGGALSLLAASKLPLQGAIAMSVPYSLKKDWRIKLAIPLSGFLPVVGKGESDAADKKTEKEHIAYSDYPTRSIADLASLLDETRNNLTRIQIPVLMIHSRSDGTVPADHQKKYLSHLQINNHEAVMLDKSGHVITGDVERNIVFHYALEFIQTHSRS